jgi:hypothetical protein
MVIKNGDNTTDIPVIPKIQHLELLNITIDWVVRMLCFQEDPGSICILETSYLTGFL